MTPRKAPRGVLPVLAVALGVTFSSPARAQDACAGLTPFGRGWWYSSGSLNLFIDIFDYGESKEWYSCSVDAPSVSLGDDPYDVYSADCTCNSANTKLTGNLSYGTTCTVCVTPTGVSGDPHFTGFDGFKFDFQGQFDTSYNLVSTNAVQANIQIVERTQHFSHTRKRWHDLPQLKEKSTWIGGFAAKIAAGDSVAVWKHLDGSLAVEFNGQQLAPGTSVGVPGGLQARYHVKHYDAHDREAVQLYFSEGAEIDVPKVYVQAPPFTFVIDAPPTFARRLDVAAGLMVARKELYGKVEGLLGHTVRPAHPLGAGVSMQQVYDDTTSVANKASNEVFKYSAALEAEFGAKYEIAGGLLGNDFQANLFQPARDGITSGLEAGGTASAHRRELRAPGGDTDNAVHAWAAAANMAPLFDAYAQVS